MNEPFWINSKEVRKILKITSCQLMHLREAGKIKFKKRGAAFLYSKEAINKLREICK